VASLSNPYDHPLTLGAVLAAHDTLVTHASCGPAISGYGSDGEDFDGASCPCQWHGALIDELANARLMVQSWPGFICGECWAASCECGYVLDTPTHASGRDRNHRFTCHASASASSGATPTWRRRTARAHACSPAPAIQPELVM
jgi:hypothetical protein